MRFSAAALLAALVLYSTPALAQPTSSRAETAFADAYALFDARLFGEAERAFAAFRRSFPDDVRLPDALYYGGEAALATGDDATAARLLGRFTERYSTHPLAPRARLALGEYFFATQQYGSALDALSAAVAENPPDEDAARALLLMGQTALRQDRPDAALGFLNRVADEYPRTPSAAPSLYAAGFADLDRDNYVGAADAFGRLASRYARTPEDRRVGLALADAYVRTGQYDRAITEAERRLPDLSGEARRRALFLLGEAALRLDRLGAAEEYFEQVDGDGAYARRARFGRARVAWERENWAEAADAFAAVRTWDDDFDALAAEATYYEGLALKSVGQIDESARRLEAVRIRAPESSFADAALFERGFLLYSVRRWDEAAESFDVLLERYPTSSFAGEAARMLGETYAALGDYRRAERANERARALGTASAELSGEVAFQQGYRAYEAGDYAEAARRLQAVYEDEPSGPRAGEALFWAAEASFQQGQEESSPAALARAETLFADFLRRFPEHRQADAARYAVAWTLFKRGDYAAAATAFERFLAQYRPSRELVPYTVDARLRLADAYFALKRFDDAVAAYRQIEQADGASGGTDYALFQIGQAQANAGRAEAAAATYDSLLTRYPSSSLRPQAIYAQGALAFQRGDYARAVASYQRVLDEHPGSPLAPKAQYSIGDALYNQGDLRGATAAYRAVLDRYPQSPFVVDALSGVQYALAAQGEDNQLDEIVRRYAEQNPDAPVLDELRFRQAEGTFQSGNLREAITAFQDFLRTGQEASLLAAANLYVGRAYADLGEPNAALPYLRRVVERFPDADVRAEAAFLLGALYLQGERYDVALDLYRALGAEAATPEEGAEARLGEAQALLGLGRVADAETLFGSVIETVPGTALADRAGLGLARALEAQGLTGEAIAFYRDLATTDDNLAGAEAAERLTTALFAGGDYAAVVALPDELGLEERFAGYPERVAAVLLERARAFRRLGEPGRADEAFGRVIGAYADTPAAEAARRER